MKQFLIAGASLLALGLTPSLAQEAPPSQSEGAALDYPCPCGSATDGALTSADIRGAQAPDDARPAKDGSVRDAMGDLPVNPMADDERSTAFDSRHAMPFPPQDVSDDDLEPGGADYPSGPPREARMSRPEGPEGSSFTEGEVVPEGVRRYQGPDMWEADDETDIDADEGPSSLADKRGGGGRDEWSGRDQRESAGAWDGPRAGPPFHRGRLHEDRTPQEAEQRGRELVTSEFEQDRQDRTASTERSAQRRQTREERKLDLARRALRTARYTVPGARFRTYEFEVDDGRRVIEIAGIDLETGRRIEVDVGRNGRTRSISAEVPLEEVPDRIWQTISTELDGFKVVHALRTLRRGMELHYEFAGFNAKGRPVTVDIGADGRDLTIRHLARG